jgi:hypothetical protein
MDWNLVVCMKIPNVVSCLRDLNVNAIHLEPSGTKRNIATHYMQVTYLVYVKYNLQLDYHYPALLSLQHYTF